jgi:hypothetical protein
MATMPMPPSQCISDRQNRTLRGMTSSPTSTVAPVVVRPDAASNTASVKLMRRLDHMRGRAPNSGITSQARKA